MLPKPHLTPELIALNKRIEAAPIAELIAFPHPTPQDFAVLGAVIQTFNYIELNFRRALAAAKAAGSLPKPLARRLERAGGGAVFEVMKSAVAALDEPSEAMKARAHLDAIAMNQPLRNLIAHWAARRVPYADYLIFLSKDDRDAHQVFGEALPADFVSKCLVDASALRGLIDFLEPHEQWAARKAAEWYTRFVSA